PAYRARGPPVARFRDPGVPGWPRREPPDGPALPPGRLSPRVSTWLGQPDRLRSASPRPVAAGERPGTPPHPPPRRSRAGAAHRAPRRADGGEPLLPGGDRPDPGGDQRPGGRAGSPSAGPTDRHGRGAGDGPGRPGRSDRPPSARGQAPPRGGLG